VIHIDFATLNMRTCSDGDFEKWYARKIGGQPDCLMGHKVRTRRPSWTTACDDCCTVVSSRLRPFLSNGFKGADQMPIVLLARSLETPWDAKKIAPALTRTLNGSWSLPRQMLHCAVLIRINRSDYNYVPDGDDCTLAGPETIPPGQCLNEGDKFWGSSGYRKIPGNTCDSSKGLQKDQPAEKDCSEGSL
jgi:hypothetical protein